MTCHIKDPASKPRQAATAKLAGWAEHFAHVMVYEAARKEWAVKRLAASALAEALPASPGGDGGGGDGDGGGDGGGDDSAARATPPRQCSAAV